MSSQSRRSFLKTLGFGGWHIAILILGESLIITITGCVLGIILTFPTAEYFGKTMGSFFPVFNVSTITIFLDIAAAFLVGLDDLLDQLVPYDIPL